MQENIKSIKKAKEIDKLKSKVKISDIFLYTSISLTFCFLIFIIIDLILSIKTTSINNYTPNFLFTFCMIVVATIVYLILLFFERKKLNYPEWFKCLIIVSVLLFFNIYPFFNLFNIIYTDILFNIVLSFIITIVGISIFYNLLKDKNDNLKTKAITVNIFGICFSVTIGVIIEIIELLSRLIMKENNLITINSLIDLSVIFITSLILNILFYFSLKKDKVFINNCLIIKE